MEEANREIGNFEYISSQKIDDWRYTNETDKIKTLFFYGDCECRGNQGW
jgi:hypothetical protein